MNKNKIFIFISHLYSENVIGRTLLAKAAPLSIKQGKENERKKETHDQT